MRLRWRDLFYPTHKLKIDEKTSDVRKQYLVRIHVLLKKGERVNLPIRVRLPLECKTLILSMVY